MANNSSKGIATPLPREGAGVGSKSVVVAYSGGLDTSYTVMKLTQEGWDVYAACANTGGFSAEQLKKNEENAYKLGAKKYVTLDVTHEYYEKSLKYMIFGNVLRNNCYPISSVRSVSSRLSLSHAMPKRSVPTLSHTDLLVPATTRYVST